MFTQKFYTLLMLLCMLSYRAADAAPAAVALTEQELPRKTDLDTSATNAKLLNLGGLLGQNPYYNNNRYGYGYRPAYPGSGGYYPNSNGFYPSTGGNYPSTGGYYPSTGSYYPSSGYYPGSGSYNPTIGYYPSGGAGYYPGSTYNPGTNILGYGGNGGYGGYNGGNGGHHQYSGYLNPDYSGARNRGYGYYAHTDRFGLPYSARDRAEYGRDRVSGGYRGYE